MFKPCKARKENNNMANFNLVVLEGNTTKELTVTVSTGEKPVWFVKGTIAVNRRKLPNEEVAKCDFHEFSVKFFHDPVNFTAHCPKGTNIRIVGELWNNKYEKDGATVTRKIIQCDSDGIALIGSKPVSNSAGAEEMVSIPETEDFFANLS